MRKLADERPKGEKKQKDYLNQTEDDLVLGALVTPEERIIVNLLPFHGHAGRRSVFGDLERPR